MSALYAEGDRDTPNSLSAPGFHLDAGASDRVLSGLTIGQPLQRTQRSFGRAWVDGFLRAAARDRNHAPDPAQQIETELRVEAATTDRLTCQLHDALRMADIECARAFGRLCGTYHAQRRASDELFASLTSLLSQCHLAELVGVRELIGHCACVAPQLVHGCLQLETGFLASHQAWMHTLARGQNADSPTPIPGAIWPAHEAWRRLYYLLVSSGLAGSRGYSKLGLEHATVMHTQQFLCAKPIAEAQYQYRLRGGGGAGAVTAELITGLPCFGFGPTTEVALATLRSNLMLFVSDATTAELVETR